MNGQQTQYFVTPMVPGVRPQDPPDYDGITFVYVFTNVITPWQQPPVNQNAVLVVANSVGFIPGMTVAIGDGQGGLAGRPYHGSLAHGRRSGKAKTVR